MKRLVPQAAIFILLVLFFVFVAFPVYADPAWDSYNDTRRRSIDQDDDFSGAETTVYMGGSGFTADTQYKVAYYDGSDSKVTTDTPWADSWGILRSEWYFPDAQGAAGGEWHCVVYTMDGSPPSDYGDVSDTDPNYVDEDLSAGTYGFSVDEEVIPEFPTVFAAMAVTGLCFGIYYWMRKRYHRQVVIA